MMLTAICLAFSETGVCYPTLTAVLAVLGEQGSLIAQLLGLG